MKANIKIFDVAVIGGGPAGMMAAITAAESGAKVILLEKNKELGKKLLLTGNGRCNLTNAEFNLKKLVENYNKGREFLFHAFSVFGPKEAIIFFEKLGIKTKIESGNRVLPLSGNAGDVLNALETCLLKNKVKVSFESPVSNVILKGNKIEKLVVDDKEVIAKKYIFCSGGQSYPATGSTGEAFKWLKDMGHHIIEPLPALVPIKLKEDWAKELQGLALKAIKLTVAQNNKKQFQETGDILFTHFGLSGPAVLNISKRVGELLKKGLPEQAGEVIICIDLYPNLNTVDLGKKIDGKITTNPKISVKNFLADLTPQRLVPVFMQSVGIDGDKPTNNITRNERVVIAKQLKQIGVTATELLGFDSAMVTSGGVLLKEIDSKTMKSKIINNLYFAGEVIDIDGKTGGFNLQACWSTGYLAGKSAIG